MSTGQRQRSVRVAVAPAEVEEWHEALAAALARADLPVTIAGPETPPEQIDYLVYNVDSGTTDLTPFKGLRAILNTWAGVEATVGRVRWPSHVPFCRMVEPGLTEGMVEYLLGHVMRYHLDIDRFQAASSVGRWDQRPPPLARERTVGILGLGALGSATAAALRPLGFRLFGWARTQKDLDGVACHHGRDGLRAVLSRAGILVVILPLTRETEGILDAETLGWLPSGACLVNAGRGPLIDDDALLDALARGHLRHATLDVFREEPLPPEHPFWRNDRVTVTPHIAAVTRIRTAAESVVEQIVRDLDGRPVLHVVDPERGY